MFYYDRDLMDEMMKAIRGWIRAIFYKETH